MEKSYNLFSYGTLMEEACVKEVIGRVPEMKPALVEGFHRFFDTDIGYYSARMETGVSIEGVLLMGLSDNEINSLDEYEGVRYGIYERAGVKARIVENGMVVDAFIYVKGKKRFIRH
ncbi:gamma-glutamylcyclotransferase family protein [Methanooceanicella nereidis]|nr:gamma-glutamylcyclotransferase family protein [Methanocella sp. CWC-04]